MKNFVAGLVIAALLPVASGLKGQDTKANARNDQDFLVRAITKGMAMVKVSELGEKDAVHKDVQAFAGRLVKHHQQMNEKLLDAARGLKLGVVTGLEKDHRETLARLGNLKGIEFDRAFLKQTADDHQQSIQLFETEAKEGQNPSLKNFAQENIAALREHHKKAQDLLEQMKIR